MFVLSSSVVGAAVGADQNGYQQTQPVAVLVEEVEVF
jgi:hypothetical protein